MKELIRDPRLAVLYDLVREDSVVADVGTDHAYLPASLILGGKIHRAFAGDVRPGPLRNAEKTVKKYGLEGKITLVLSDGLDSFPPGCADDVVIAGMCGILIADILSRCAWIKDPEKLVIAQPMTYPQDVRRFFFENGFDILDETVCRDGGRLYVCMRAVFDGKNREYSYGQILFGTRDKLGPDAEEYTAKQLLTAKKRLFALEASGQDPDEAKLLREAAEEYEKEQQKEERK